MTEMIEAVARRLGYTSLRPGQEAVIQAVMAGRDVLGILPTGSGKTLCYQLPGLARPGVTIVIEPLLALMRDQLLRLQMLGEKHVAMMSSADRLTEQTAILNRLADLKFVFMAPEMLGRRDVQDALRHAPVQLIVVDEAHCIYQWGPDFRPDYLRLSRLRDVAPSAQVLALTATAPKIVQDVIVQTLAMKEPEIYNGGVDRPNLFIGRQEVADGAAQQNVLDELLRATTGSAIVYCRTKKDCERFATRFAGLNGRHAAYYHAGLDAHTRLMRERQFQDGALDTLFATSAFGMGVDKPDVRLVVYLGVPATLEEYLQAIGRAGRDGQFAITLLLYTQKDWQQTTSWIGSLPAPSLITAIYQDPQAYAGSDDPQIQLALAYNRAGYSIAQVNSALDERLGTKARDFESVTRFLQVQGCIRAPLMAHFDSDARQHDAQCCGTVTPDLLTQLPKVNRTVMAPDKDWRSVFARIFQYGTGPAPRI